MVDDGGVGLLGHDPDVGEHVAVGSHLVMVMHDVRRHRVRVLELVAVVLAMVHDMVERQRRLQLALLWLPLLKHAMVLLMLWRPVADLFIAVFSGL